MKKLEEILEPGIRDLVLLLRVYGFNTFCSCGHRAKRYVQMECYSDSEITKLYNVLKENGFDEFEIRFYWDTISHKRLLEVRLMDKKS